MSDFFEWILMVSELDICLLNASYEKKLFSKNWFFSSSEGSMIMINYRVILGF